MEEYSSEYLLVFEFLDSSFDIETIEDEEGDLTNEVFLNLVVGFSLYNRDGILIDREDGVKSIHYQSRPSISRVIVIGPNMKKAGKDLFPMSRALGEEYIWNFYPTPQEGMSFIYSGRPFTEAAAQMRLNAWDKSIRLLEPFLESSDPKIQERARHNIRVIDEIKRLQGAQ